MVKCNKCQAENLDSALFCCGCGERLTDVTKEVKPKAQAEFDKGNYDNIGDRVVLYPDGKYRWVYELNMLKTPILLFTILKVMLICAAAPALVMLFSTIGSEGFFGAILVGLQTFAITYGIMFVLSIVAYLILAAIYGGKYVVVFEMDDRGIEHIQQKKQFKKAEVIGELLLIAGALKNNPGAMGKGLLTASHSSIYSPFEVVKKVILIPDKCTIKLNSLFAKNQIYLPYEDYAFVMEYILLRCHNAKVIEK
ncbi:MAG: hypothetical protein Q4B67_02865 [Eubacteriales bacterium]|nr:hypothetical protein [Eubacteriales bacterium]